MTLSITSYRNIKKALILLILMQKCSDRYIIPPPTHTHTHPHTSIPPSPFSPSLISRTVSVGVKHNVYLLTTVSVDVKQHSTKGRAQYTCRIRFGIVLVTASYGHYGQRAARIGPDRIIMPDPTSRIRFGSAPPKKAWTILCKSGLDPIWVAWSGSGQTHLVQKQAGVKEPWGPFLAERNRPATSFPLSDWVAFFHTRPGSYCAKPGRIWL